MSQAEANTKNSKKQGEKKNTDAWKEKQAMKKKEKEDKDKDKDIKKQDEKKDDKKEDKKQDKKSDKKQDKKDKKKKDKDQPNPSQSKPHPPTQKPNPPQLPQAHPQIPKKHKNLQTIETLLTPKYHLLQQNRGAQVELIEKQILNLIRPGDTILYVGKFKLSGIPAKLLPGAGKFNFQVVEVPGVFQHDSSEILCQYEDTPFLISQQVDKLLIQATTIFQEGSCLIPKGLESLCICAKYYNKPIIAISGSWNYSHLSISNYSQLENIFGEELLDKFDFVCGDMLDYLCLESGAVIGSQVSGLVEQGYRGFGFADAKW